MIIERGVIVSNKADEHITHIVTPDCDIYYVGFVFVSGKRAGKESVEYIASVFSNEDVSRFIEIYGNYFICLDYKNSDKKYCFSDNSGMFKAYRYKDSISTSFLELVDFYDEIRLDDLDYTALTEFFHFGFSYFERTFIKEIKKIDSNEYCVFEKDALSFKDKDVGSIDSKPTLDIDTLFADCIYAVGGEKVSLDLTGGYDSRLVLSFFEKSDVDFELAISGLKTSKDIIIAKEISQKIRKPFFPTYHSTEKLEQKDLLQLFSLSDSQLDILSYHRNAQLNDDRKERKITLQIGGGGGGLYKDFWWIQDFPFYSKSKTNVDKLYDYRVEITPFAHEILGETLQTYSKALRANTIKSFQPYILGKNTQSYDNIFWNYKMKTNAGVYSTVSTAWVSLYSPLLESELVKMSFHLPRRVRFFNNFHREIITRNSPLLAKMKTGSGTTASSSFGDVISDSFSYLFGKFKQVVRLILRKVVKRTYMIESPTDVSIYKVVRESAFFDDYFSLLQKEAVLNTDLLKHNLSDAMVGRVCTVGMLIDRLKK